MLLSSEDSIRIESGILLSSGPSTCLNSNKLFFFSITMMWKAAGDGKCAQCAQVFIAVGQTTDLFPFLSWHDTKWYRMLSYTVNMKMRQKMAQGLLFYVFNEWVSLHCFMHIANYYLSLFLAFYQIHHGCVENDTPPPFYESFLSQNKGAQEVCVWCRVLGTNQSILW